jgi:hypothetical protein
VRNEARRTSQKDINNIFPTSPDLDVELMTKLKSWAIFGFVSFSVVLPIRSHPIITMSVVEITTVEDYAAQIAAEDKLVRISASKWGASFFQR